MTEYYESVGVADVASRLIREHHSVLGQAKIIYLFRDKPIKNKEKEVIARAFKVSTKYKAITGLDYGVWVSEPDWNSMTDREKLACVDHELCHFGLDENGNWTTFNHDFEGFNAVLKRHGYWKSDFKKMHKVIQQMELPFDKKSELSVVK